MLGPNTRPLTRSTGLIPTSHPDVYASGQITNLKMSYVCKNTTYTGLLKRLSERTANVPTNCQQLVMYKDWLVIFRVH
jgi:hypothetical protein